MTDEQEAREIQETLDEYAENCLRINPPPTPPQQRAWLAERWGTAGWPLPPRQPDMIGMLREWQLDERARAADEQAQRDRLRAWVVGQTGPGGVPVKDWMEDE